MLIKQREQLDRDLADYVVGDGVATADEYRREVLRLGAKAQALAREIARLEAGGLPQRPPRRMPGLERIARFHSLGPAAHCVRCGFARQPPEWARAAGWLERAHIIDRVFDGLDLESNLLPLCSPCHLDQPVFRAGEEAPALRWFGRPISAWGMWA